VPRSQGGPLISKTVSASRVAPCHPPDNEGDKVKRWSRPQPWRVPPSIDNQADPADHCSQAIVKGGSRNRGARKAQRFPVPITPGLALRLKQAAAGRPGNATLLLQSDGATWQSRSKRSRGTLRSSSTEALRLAAPTPGRPAQASRRPHQ
jgi:hypothetical protein